MVALIDCAGYGMPLWVWTGMQKNEPSVLEVGRQRAMREDGGFSYRNAHILAEGDTVLGMVIGYRLAKPYDAGDLASIPEAFRPLVELETLVPGSWYLNVVAVHAEHRGCGLGSRLLEHACGVARRVESSAMSIIFESRNDGAYRLYKKLGYLEKARRPRIPFPGEVTGSEEWVLMEKALV